MQVHHYSGLHSGYTLWMNPVIFSCHCLALVAPRALDLSLICWGREPQPLCIENVSPFLSHRPSHYVCVHRQVNMARSSDQA